jgi:membrane protein implicated in regulation of membrane protease activity
MFGLAVLVLFALLIGCWQLAVAVIALWIIACLATSAWDRYQQTEYARHRQARREIDRIAEETMLAMLRVSGAATRTRR